MTQNQSLTFILPAKNEAAGLSRLLPNLRNLYPKAEILVVDDGSTDHTATICAECRVTYLKHLYSKGNGAAVKTGIRHATGDILVFMDADGQHQASDVANLLTRLQQGYDMVVGTRHKTHQASFLRRLGNACYNQFASYVVGHPVLDLTSGYRVAKTALLKPFIPLLPNGFSSPSTLTLAFFRSGYSVYYEPITVLPRVGKSHLKIMRDGIRFLVILYKITTLYSPLKIFIPLSLLHFMVAFGYGSYTFVTQGRFTNMDAVFLTTAILIFLIGLVSEQMTVMMYWKMGEKGV